MVLGCGVVLAGGMVLGCGVLCCCGVVRLWCVVV